jgi:hypothetical protein
MRYLSTKFHLPNSSGSLVTGIRPKPNLDFSQPPFCCLVFHKNKTPVHKLHILEIFVNIHNFRALYCFTTVTPTSKFRASTLLVVLNGKVYDLRF